MKRMHVFPALLAPLAFGILPALGQPTITSLNPSANARSAPTSGAVQATFNQPLTSGTTALRVFSSQRGGLRPGNSGTSSISGNTLSFAPSYAFRPGETIHATVTTAAQSSSGALATPRVYQFATAVTSGVGTFIGGPDVSVNTSPYNVVAADVDNDGDLDVLSSAFNGSTVSVRLNNGSGVFSGGFDPSVGSQPRSVATADIDGDGDLDLLTANYNANSASIRFNNGSGTFSGSTDVSVGSQPQSVATADIDGDGDLDFLVANGADNTVTVRFNNGSGAFGAGTIPAGTDVVPVGLFPFNIAMGDVDGDGDMDLVTANLGAGSTSVSIRLNNGAGLFSGGSDPTVGSRPRGVTLGDLDGDGDLDLLSANFGSSNTSVRLNNGSGSFSGVLDLAAGTNPNGVVASDIDADGDLDVLISNITFAAGVPNTVTVYKNFGNATFPSTSTVTVATGPNQLALADMNNDGAVDLLTANFTSNTVSVRFNLTDLIVSTPQNANGTYNNVTITGPSGVGTLTGALSVYGTLNVQNGGTLLTNCQPLTGPGNFVLSAGGTLGICDGSGIEATGTVGSVQLAGSRSFSTDASYIYNGTVVQVTGGALPATVRNLTTTNTNSVTLTNAVTVTQVVKVEAAGNLVLNGKTLTLPSSSAGTALVWNSGTGAVQGSSATMQRYIDPSKNSGLGYRHYSAPVAAATVASLTTSGYSPVVNSVYNTSATPNLVTPFPTIYGYDQSRLTLTNSSTPFDKGFFSPVATTDGLVTGRGYAINITASAKVAFAGTLNTGNLTLALARNSGTTATNAGWQLLGNPYPSPLDWSLIAPIDRPNLTGSMYVFESSGQYGGSYRAYVNGKGSALIGSSQGFFARVNEGQTSGSLTFRNTQRVTAYNQQVDFRRGQPDTRPTVQLQVQGTSGPTDAVVVYAESGATTGFDAEYDAAKIVNPSGLSLASTTTSTDLAIDGQPQFISTTAVPLSITVPAADTYTFTATDILNVSTALDVLLIDNQTAQQINLRLQPTYAFSMTAQQAGAPLTTRFVLRFAAAGIGGGGARVAPSSASALAAAAVTLYPNPAHTTFTLVVPEVKEAKNMQVSLLNGIGQEVYRQIVALTTTGTSFVISVADLAPGIYTLMLQGQKELVVKRIVVK